MDCSSALPRISTLPPIQRIDNSTATGKRRRSAASSGDRTRTFWTFCLIRGLNPDLLDLEKSRRSLATMPARSLPYERGRPQTDAAHHCSDTLLQQKYLESFQNTRRLLSRPVELLWTLSGPCDSFHQWIAVPRSLASLQCQCKCSPESGPDHF